MKRFLGVLIIIFVLIFLYGRYIEPKNIKINEYVLKNENIPNSFKDLKFVQFSDLLYDKNFQNLDTIKKEINDLKPDIVFFTGDLFNSKNNYDENDYNNVMNFLKDIDVSLYKFAIMGDNDINNIDQYKRILDESNFILLNNENFLLFYKDSNPILLIGLNNDYNITELLQSDVPASYTICLVHKPDEIINLNNDNINLVLTGHSLGGIINAPYYGGIIKKDGAKTYINNYYKVNNIDLYVSNGLGYEDFEFRLFNTPSINVFRFTD